MAGKQPSDKIKRQAAKAGKAIAGSVSAAIGVLRGSLDAPAIKSAVASGNADLVLRTLNWSAFITQLGGAGSEIQTLAAGTAAEGVGLPAHISAKLSFDLKDPRAIAFATHRVGTMVTQVTDQQRELIRGIITSSVRDGLNPQAATERLSRVVGLNARQAVALDNFYQRSVGTAIKGGYSLESAISSASASVYRSTLIDQRSLMIARTEIMTAQNFGRLEGFRAAVDQGLVGADSMKQWSTSQLENTCEICEPMDGETVAIDANFSSGDDQPPLHPNCECVMELLPTDPNADSGDGSGDGESA